MLALRRFGIGTRLGAAFAFCIVAMCMVGAIGLSAMSRVEAASQQLIANDAASMQAAQALMMSTQEMGHDVAQHLYVYDGDLKAQDAIAGEVADDVKADQVVIKKLLDRASSSTRTDARQFAAAYAAVDRLRTSLLLMSRAETVDGIQERTDSRTTYREKFLPAVDDFRVLSESFSSKLEADEKAQLSANASSSKRATLMIGVIVAFAAVAAALLGWFITRSITKPVERMRIAATFLADGDVDAAARTQGTAADGARDQIAATEDAFAQLVEYLHEASKVAGHLADGDTTIAVSPRSSADQLGHAMERMRASASDMAHVAGQIAAGETGVTAPVRGERDSLGNAFRRMIEDLEMRQTQRSMQARIDATRAEESHTLLVELAAMSDQLTSASSNSERTAGEVTSGMEEIAGSMAELADNAQRQVDVLREAASAAVGAAEAAEGTTAVVGQGVASVDLASTAMSTLNDSAEHVSGAIAELSVKSERFGGIVQTITAIAEQTNLLALNAAIEAARAGDQGRGFAVVADEVRKLAEESQVSAAQISAIVAEIRAETERTVLAVEESLTHAAEGSRTVAEARTAFLEIETSVQNVLSRTDEIRGAANDAVQLAQSASTHTEQVSAATEETAASMQEVSATASELSRLADSLSRTASGAGVVRGGVDASAPDAVVGLHAA